MERSLSSVVILAFQAPPPRTSRSISIQQLLPDPLLVSRIIRADHVPSKTISRIFRSFNSFAHSVSNEMLSRWERHLHRSWLDAHNVCSWVGGMGWKASQCTEDEQEAYQRTNWIKFRFVESVGCTASNQITMVDFTGRWGIIIQRLPPKDSFRGKCCVNFMHKRRQSRSSDLAKNYQGLCDKGKSDKTAEFHILLSHQELFPAPPHRLLFPHKSLSSSFSIPQDATVVALIDRSECFAFRNESHEGI